MSTARSALDGALRHFTTDRAVRVGVTTAAWSVAASYARGLLPRTAVQQAAATGVIMTAHYEIGATLWAGIASTAAGLPGQRPGPRALLTAAAVSTGVGKALEAALRHRSGDRLALGAAWSTARMVSVVGLAGGLVTASDLVAHDVLHLRRTPATTLALDLGVGGLMALGTIARRRYRSAHGDGTGPTHHAVTVPTQSGQGLANRAKTAAYIGGAVAGSSLGLGALAVAEQAGARRVSRLINANTPQDLGEFGDLVGHLVMFSGFAVGSLFALRAVRVKIEQRAAAVEPAYNQPPQSPYVSCGPMSRVPFDAVGKDGRRLVSMRLSAEEIEHVVGEPSAEPVRVVIPNKGSDDARVELALSELRATGGIERSLICVAAPTGVGYVSYVMAEALEYLTRGDCAIVVPQYAYVPSALALDRTHEGTALQRAVVAGIVAELSRRDVDRQTRVVQFGESLGAQVAVDIGGDQGVAGFDEVGLWAGLYLGVPFRSDLWRAYLRDPQSMTRGGRLINVPDAEVLPEGDGRRHVMINHHDDPINKFAYTMVVMRPWWLGPSATRPPSVPRETFFRPVTSFVLALVDLLNGMHMKPGQFHRVGHDYRIDMRQALQKTYSLPVDPDQAIRIEAALRMREQEWAERRLIAKTGEKALRAVRDTINSWGSQSVNLELSESGGEAASNRLVDYLNARLGRNPAAPTS